MTITVNCLTGTQVIADAPSPCEDVTNTFPVTPSGLVLSILMDDVLMLTASVPSTDPLYIATGLQSIFGVKNDQVDWGFDDWANGDGTVDAFNDAFTRANAANLGAGWTQTDVGGLSSNIRVNSNKLKGADKAIVANDTVLALATPVTATAIGDQHSKLKWTTFGGLNSTPVRPTVRGNGTDITTWIGYYMIFQTTGVNEPEEDHWIYDLKICHFNKNTNTETVLSSLLSQSLLIGTFPTFTFKAIG